jgi:hypothetical protein
MQKWVVIAVSFTVLACCLNLKLVAADSPAAPEATPEQWQTWWEDIEKGEPHASRAVLNFAMRPEQAVAYIKERVIPLTITEEEVKKLIGDLNSDDQNVWKPAFDKFRYLDPRLAIDLSTLMDTTLESLARTRLVEVLCDYDADYLLGRDVKLRPTGEGHNFYDGRASWWAEAKIECIGDGMVQPKKTWRRAVRAVVLLEHIATPDALALLKDLAGGHPDAQPTKVAQEALDNLQKK